jgi:4-hydroxyphenylpyruvate dioxygenase
MDELGTELILVCSSVQLDASGDTQRLAGQFARLAELAGQRRMRCAYEALALGQQQGQPVRAGSGQWSSASAT